MSEYDAELRELMGKIKADAAEAARQAIRDYLGTIVRGNKVLYPSLPYAKQGATAKLGHVGAVQPDGTTVTIDAASGIIHANSGLPAGTKGDLLYDDGTTWAERHIAEGNQGDVLLNDRSNSGVPIWQSIAQALTPGTSGSTQVYSQAGIDKMLYLWNGTSNNPAPSGWQNLGFNDSAWGTGIAVTPAWAGSPPSPSTSLWCTSASTPAGATALLRNTFSIAGGAIAACTLHLYVDDQIDGAWINGTLVQGPFSGGGGIDQIITFGGSGPPLSLLNLNGNNVLAVQHTNGVPPGAFIAYVLAITQTSGSGGASPPTIPASALPPSVPVFIGTPTEGCMLVFRAGIWQLLAPGTPGQTMKTVGSDPQWV